MILVFGENGQVARELSIYKNVRALNRSQVDLADPSSCRDAIYFYKPEAVINAAAYTAVDRAENEVCLARRVNGEAPFLMASACAEIEIPFVHLSTDYVFDGSGTTPWRCYDPTDPKNVYGLTKLEGEQAIQASGCTYAILRTSWVVSAHGKNFVKTMLKLSKTKSEVRVVADQIGGPTCARDIAHTCVSISKQLVLEPKKSGVYHYAGQPDVSWWQLANSVFAEAGCSTIATPISTSSYPTPAIRPYNSRLNCSTTEDVFGISRPYWRDGLKDIINELGEKYDEA